MKQLLTATAISALMISGAFAQTTTPSPSTPPAPAPSATPSTTPAPSAAASNPSFLSSQQSDQWLASKFSGTDVIGPNNEKIGDVSDILFDKSGKVVGVIVGVGGFLGIGQKDVAIDMSAFQIIPAAQADANTGSTNRAATSNDPNDVKLKVSWTKDQLKSAPSFERYKAASATSTAPTRPATPAR